jgi:hypothetical protein
VIGGGSGSGGSMNQDLIHFHKRIAFLLDLPKSSP